jgi:hypothetical protein
MVQEFVQADDEYNQNKLDPDSVYGAAVLDIVTGNTDRHSGNYLVVDNRFIPIDHGLTFPDSGSEFRPDAVVGALVAIHDAHMSPEFAQQVRQRIEDTDWEKIGNKWDLSSQEEHQLFDRISKLREAFDSYEPEAAIKHVLAELSKESTIAGGMSWR